MITAKAAFVLRMVDDFTGIPIQKKNFWFRINGQIVHPLEKEEGLYVFLEPVEPKESIEIVGVDYYPRYQVVEKEKLSPRNPVVDVRMYIRADRAWQLECDLITGQIKKKNTVFPAEVCTLRSLGLSLKEIRSMEDGEKHLILQGFTKEKLIGKSVALQSKKETEVFVITEKIGMNEYRIAGSPAGNYPKDTPLLRAYCSITDESGNYAIPIETGEQEKISEVIILQHK